MLLKRTTTEILRDAMTYIGENTPITNFYPGSIARAIVEAIAPEIGTSSQEGRTSLYDVAQQLADQASISKSTGEDLDLIGGLFSYPRRIEQVRKEDGSLVEEPISDEMYRYEITQVVPGAATANYASIRMALLMINGVKDVVPKEYSHGTGSFSFMLVPMGGFLIEDLAHKAEEAIAEVKGFGIRPHVELPVEVPMTLELKLMFHESASENQRGAIAFEVSKHLINHFSTFELGQGFLYHDLTQEVMNVNEKIMDFEVLRFTLNNEPVLLTNHPILEDERLRLADILVQ